MRLKHPCALAAGVSPRSSKFMTEHSRAPLHLEVAFVAFTGKEEPKGQVFQKKILEEFLKGSIPIGLKKRILEIILG